MDYHQNARLTVHSREQLARRVLEKPEDGGQVGSPISRAGAGGSRRPVVAPAPLPTHHSFSFIGKGFCSSSAALQRLADRPPGDRKSTRLNSSHHIISYALFFLKKK